MTHVSIRAVGQTRTRVVPDNGAGEDGGVFAEFGRLVETVTEDDPVLTFPTSDPAELENEIGSDETIATTIDQF